MPEPQMEVSGFIEFPDISFIRGEAARNVHLANLRTAHDSVLQRLIDCLETLALAMEGNVLATSTFRNCFGDVTLVRLRKVFLRFNQVADHFQKHAITYRVGFNHSPGSIASVNSGLVTAKWDNIMFIERPYFLKPNDGPARSHISVIIHELTHGVIRSSDFSFLPGDLTLDDIDIGSVELLASTSPESAVQVADCYELFSSRAPSVLAMNKLVPLDGPSPPEGKEPEPQTGN